MVEVTRRAEPVVVDARDAELLAVARALFTPDAYPSIEATLTSQLAEKKPGPTAMRILERTLAKGAVKTLARLGGARLRVRPTEGGGRPARVFEVRPAPRLAFGPYTFGLLRWLTSTAIHPRAEGAPVPGTPETLGDELVVYLTLRLVEGRRLERTVTRALGGAGPLAWLGFVRPLARLAQNEKNEKNPKEPIVAPPAFAPLLATEDGRTVVECLAGDLTRRWAASAAWDEYDVLDGPVAVRIGTLERAVLGGFLDEVDRIDRWDLATFLVDAAARVLPSGVDPRDVARRVAPPVRTEEVTLRVRSEARRRAGALFDALGRIGRQREELALVRFIDDGYDVAQAILTAWELLPRDAYLRSAEVIRALEALAPA